MYQIIMVIFILLLYIVFLVLYYLIFRNFSNKKRLNFIDYWDDDWKNKSDKKYFKQISKHPALKNYDSINIYSVFGNSPVSKEKGAYNIQFSGESIFRNPDLFHLNLIPEKHDFIEKKNIIDCPPFMHLFLNSIFKNNNYNYIRSISEADVLKKNFCLFSVSNGEAKQRVDFFKKLSNFKKIDSCGKIENNKSDCPGRDEYNSNENCTFISAYKFMICFENCSMYNYCTEKILNAYMCGTIPIYWGCPNISDFINMDSIFYLPAEYTMEEEKALIKQIIDCDSNLESYIKKYNQPLFKNNKIPKKLKFTQIFKNTLFKQHKT